MNKTTRPPRLAIVPAAPTSPPPAPPPDRTYAEIGDDFARLSIELAGALELDQLDPEERRAVRTAFTLSNKAAVSLALLDEQQHAARVWALDDRCVCGWDRGSHLVAEPHLCEEDERCRGFVLATGPIDTLTEAVRDTERPPAPAPTLVDAYEGAP